jgi:Na+-transporting NADH:ubiquinone oxidoreductase subunit B
MVVASGLENAVVEGLSWSHLFLGEEIGAFGAGSALLCLAGVAVLIYKGAASARTVLGAIIGLIAATLLVNGFSSEQALWQLPWYWHLALGNFVFGIAFIATDPTPSPMTAEGRWIQGALIGVLTILIRTLNPAHPEGTLYAILLAALTTPFIDHFVIRVRLARWHRRWRIRP